MALLHDREAYASPPPKLSYNKAWGVPHYQYLTTSLGPHPFLTIRKFWFAQLTPSSLCTPPLFSYSQKALAQLNYSIIAIATMIPSLKASTKSAGLIAWPPNTKANTKNQTPVLPTSTHPNFRGTNKKRRSRQSWKRNSTCTRCHCSPEKRMPQECMYRRQLLLASTSLPLKSQQMIAAMPPPPDFTNYHNLANAVHEAEKFKNSSHASPEINDVFCWLRSPESLKPPNGKSPVELSGVAAVPPAQQLLPPINEKEVVTARVRRPAALKRMKDEEEQLVLEGIEVTNEKPLCFHVYIILGQEEDNDEEEELYLGTFSHMPPLPKQKRRHNSKQDFEQKRARRCCLSLGMNDMLSHRPLNAHQAEGVTVKLVPTFKVDDDPIKVASIFIDST